jgi:hypothetical protein
VDFSYIYAIIITITQLKKIKMATDRKTPIGKLEKLREEGIKDSSMLDYLVKNWLSADDANDAMDALLDEYELNDD